MYCQEVVHVTEDPLQQRFSTLFYSKAAMVFLLLLNVQILEGKINGHLIIYSK